MPILAALSFTYLRLLHCGTTVIPARSMGETGVGTWLDIGGNDLRYAKTDFKSSSVILLMKYHGIGGKMGRPPSCPRCFPLRIAPMKFSSVHAPSPVIESGVRLAA